MPYSGDKLVLAVCDYVLQDTVVTTYQLKQDLSNVKGRGWLSTSHNSDKIFGRRQSVYRGDHRCSLPEGTFRVGPGAA